MKRKAEFNTEKRRKQLLDEMRILYSSTYTPPAIHPRYKAFYNILENEKEDFSKSSLKLRIFVCIICFICYMMLDYGNIGIAHFDSQKIHENISYQMQFYEISEVLNNYEQTGTFR